MNDISFSLREGRASEEHVKIQARYRIATANGSEWVCDATAISLHSLTLQLKGDLPVGERVAIYLGDIGRIAAVVVGVFNRSTVLSLELSFEKRGKLARRIDTLKAQQSKEPDRQEMVSASYVADSSMRRFCKNLEAVVKDLVQNSRQHAGGY